MRLARGARALLDLQARGAEESTERLRREAGLYVAVGARLVELIVGVEGDGDEGAAGAEPRDGAASAPRSAPPAPPPSSRYGSDRENEQVSAAKSSRRKSILRTLGKSLGEENEREARRNALNRRFSDVPEFEVFGFQGTPEKGGAASPDFGGSPGLFTAKSPGGLISQLDTDTPVTSPVRSSPRLRG